MQKWEYNILMMDGRVPEKMWEEADKLGGKGWELVSATTMLSSSSPEPFCELPVQLLYFKRPKP